MTANRPTTLAECFLWLTNNLTHKQLEELKSLSREELWQTHFTLVPIVKEHLLDDNEGLHQRLEKSAFCDDPDLAGQIVDAFWDHLQIAHSERPNKSS